MDEIALEEMVSESRVAVIEGCLEIQAQQGNWTVREATEGMKHRVNHTTGQAQIEKLRTAGIVKRVQAADGRGAWRTCRHSGRRCAIYEIVPNALQLALERKLATGRLDPVLTQEEDLPIDPQATRAKPGSPRKVEIMAERYRRGFRVCNPQDSGYGGDPLGY